MNKIIKSNSDTNLCVIANEKWESGKGCMSSSKKYYYFMGSDYIKELSRQYIADNHAYMILCPLHYSDTFIHKERWKPLNFWPINGKTGNPDD